MSQLLPVHSILGEKCTGVAAVEIKNEDEVPDGTYLFIDYICPSPDCDCKRVMLEIYHYQKNKRLTDIEYTFDKKRKFDIPEADGRDKYANHNDASHFFLEYFRELAVRNKKFCKNLEKRYHLAKKKTGKRA